MTLSQLYKQGRVEIGPCLGADTFVRVKFNTPRRRTAAMMALTRAKGNLQGESRNSVRAYVPTRVVRRLEKGRA